MDIDLLSNLMENMPDAIYFKDRSSRFLSINRALADLYGLKDPALAIGKTDFDFYPEEQAKEMMADERRIVLSGESIVGKQECETMTDGSRRWFSTTKLPLRDRNGDIVGADSSGRGAALALYHDSIYPVGRERLSTGDRILLFTDGLFEAYSEAGEAYGEGRLHETVGGLTGAPTSKLLEQILGDVRAFGHDTAFSDDVCMLCVERAD